MGRPKSRVTLVCKRCGKEYEVQYSRAATSSYCSIECKNGWVPEDELKCEQCGKTYRRPTAHREGSRFCTRKCRDEYRKENRHIVVCQTCGKPFGVPPSQVDKRKHCDKYCAVGRPKNSWRV